MAGPWHLWKAGDSVCSGVRQLGIRAPGKEGQPCWWPPGLAFQWGLDGQHKAEAAEWGTGSLSQHTIVV